MKFFFQELFNKREQLKICWHLLKKYQNESLILVEIIWRKKKIPDSRPEVLIKRFIFRILGIFAKYFFIISCH